LAASIPAIAAASTRYRSPPPGDTGSPEATSSPTWSFDLRGGSSFANVGGVRAQTVGLVIGVLTSWFVGCTRFDESADTSNNPVTTAPAAATEPTK
jgi:hypothetical protein